MNHLAVDLLQPGLERIMTGLHRIASLPADHAAKTQVLKWLQRLNVMRAQDELSPDDARQMVFDITQGYNALENFLKSGK
jgi:hypothetical protein